ncbi:MAG TPA: BT_2262 family domain-containing protein [Bacteroidales bacterium]|nr:BT_2262 family domain-containing protein [Bacteroidales bacterium]
MQSVKYIIILALVPFFMGCERELDTDNVSTVTTYVRYNLTGGDLVTIPLGTTYVEPGFTAFEGDTNKTDRVVVEGEVDDTQIGLYTVSYSAVNSDGYTSSVERNVVVYDPNAPETDLSGDYSARVSRNSNPIRSYTNLSVSVEKLAPGFFYVSDLLGGFYDQGRDYAYGPAYAMTGYVILNADNTLTNVGSFNSGFGDSLNDFTGGVYDPVTGSLSWHAFYTGSNFDYTVMFERLE